MRDVDQIIERIKSSHSTVSVWQLQVTHLGMGDDGIWFFHQPDSEFEVQIESSSGMCPFLVETDESSTQFTANSIDEAVEILTKLLHLI